MKPFGLRIADSPNTLDAATPEPRDVISLSQITTALRRQRFAIAIPVAVCIVLGIAYLATTPKVYVASSTLMLDANMNRAVEQAGAIDGQNLTEVALENARLVIGSDAISRSVVDTLALQRNPSFLQPPSSGLSIVLGGIIGIVRVPFTLLRPSQPEQAAMQPTDAAAMDLMLRDAVARALRTGVSVDRVGRSAAFAISYASHDPSIAAGVVNAYAEAYVADVLNANFESTERTTQWMHNRLDNLEAGASQAANDAEVFRAANGLVSTRSATMSEDAVSRLNTEMSVAIADVARARATVESYDAIVLRGVAGLKTGAPVGVGRVENVAQAELQQRLADAVAQLARVTRDHGLSNPQVAILQSQVDTSADRLFVYLTQELERARSDLAIAEARVTALRGSLQTAMDETSRTGGAQVELLALEKRAETLSTLYQTFLTRFQEIDQQKTFPISNVRVIGLADMPVMAAGPRASRVLLAAIFLGLIFGLIAAAIREWRERFLRTAEDVQLEAGQVFLGYLPDVKMTTAAMTPEVRASVASQTIMFRAEPRAVTGARRRVLNRTIYALQNPRSVYAETLRSVRLAAEIAVNGGQQRVIGVTSVRPGEGKSSVALNLAGSIASGGASVLLIDADPRRPGLSTQLGVTSGLGLVEAALGKVAWTEVLCDVGTSRVHVLPCVTPSGFHHSAEFLASRGMQTLIDEARQAYDYVVIDLAPLGPVVDARVVMRSIHHLILVAEWGKTPKSLLRSMIASDHPLAERMMGVVLNKVDMTALRDFVGVSSVEAYYGEYGDYITGTPPVGKAMS